MRDEAIAAALAEAFRKAKTLDAPVNDRLALYADAIREHFGDYADAFDALVARLTQAKAGSSAPRVGDPLPPFVLPDDQGNLVSSTEMLSRGPVAVTFLRGHWCPFCRLHAHALAQVGDRADQAGGKIVAISPERQPFTKMQKGEARASFKILSDIENGYALSLGLAIWIDSRMQMILKDFGRDLSLYQGTENWFVPIPATFIVNRTGLITARFVDPDYSRRMDVDDLVLALQKIR